jgi:hypothetical protein
MNTLLKFVFLGSLILYLPAVSAQSGQLSKKEQKQLDFIATRSIIENEKYIFLGETALSADSRSFRLDASTNFLRVYKKMVQIQLYYYGNSSSPNSAMDDNQNIIFMGPVENVEVDVNEKKMRFSIRFNAKSEKESFDVTLQVSSNGNATINIYSNLRDRMRYVGKVMLPKPVL